MPVSVIEVTNAQMSRMRDVRRATWRESHGNAYGESRAFPSDLAALFPEIGSQDLAEVRAPNGDIFLFVTRDRHGDVIAAG